MGPSRVLPEAAIPQEPLRTCTGRGALDSGAMPHPRHVTATRYVTPLREGGSLPGLVEADDEVVSPASTIIQPSAVHTGLTDDPAAELDHLFETLVR